MVWEDIRRAGRERALSGWKRMLCEHEDVARNSCAYIKALGMSTRDCDHRAMAGETGGSLGLAGHLPSSRLNGRPLLKGMKWGVVEQEVQLLSWLLCTPVSHPCAHTLQANKIIKIERTGDVSEILCWKGMTLKTCEWWGLGISLWTVSKFCFYF